LLDNQIKWENRLLGSGYKTCLVTVDGTDCPIYEPRPFSKAWYSHKLKGPGLRYEVAVCIQTGDIVWFSGGFPCGRWPDLKIFRRALKQMLNVGEMVEADKGYRGEPSCVRTPTDWVSYVDRKAKSRARSRHETVNRRLKQWGCLRQTFRHDRRVHKVCFAAVAVCTQLCFDRGEGPFHCFY
jgi:DDE superfamily endonuclease